jgi:hypothetical protein
MISRRDLISAAAGAVLLRVMRFAERAGEATPILDTHIHLAGGLHRGEHLRDGVGVTRRAMDASGVERAICECTAGLSFAVDALPLTEDQAATVAISEAHSAHNQNRRLTAWVPAPQSCARYRSGA